MIGTMTDLHAPDPFARAEASAAILKRLAGAPGFDAAVVLGSGWLAAADAIGAAELEVPLADLGGFELPTPEGHAPAGRDIKHGNHRILLFLGRVHMYEGYAPHTVVHGVRTAIAAGCRTVVLTNAAGGVNPAYAVGQPVLISDHLNLTRRSPRTPPAAPRWPGRSPPGTRRGSPTSPRRTRDGCATWRGGTTRPSPRACTPCFPARTTRRPPRSGCCAPRAPISSACPPRSKRSPRATSGRKYSRSRWSRTLPPA